MISRSKFRTLRGSVTPERRSQTGADKIGLERNKLDPLMICFQGSYSAKPFLREGVMIIGLRLHQEV